MEKPSPNESQTIVEIGPNWNPVYKLFEDEILQKIGAGSTYIAIDCSEEELGKFKKYPDDPDEKGRHAIVGDLRALPLKDGVADQIWLMNVFGGLENRAKKLPDGTLRWEMGISGVFHELARVMKQKGKIYIGELYHPSGKIDWLTDEDYSIFGLEKKVYNGPEEVESFLKKMRGKESIIESLQKARDYVPFVIELVKK